MFKSVLSLSSTGKLVILLCALLAINSRDNLINVAVIAIVGVVLLMVIRDQKPELQVKISKPPVKPQPAAHNAQASICAFAFNSNSEQPATYIIPEIMAPQSELVVPPEFNHFLKK